MNICSICMQYLKGIEIHCRQYIAVKIMKHKNMDKNYHNAHSKEPTKIWKQKRYSIFPRTHMEIWGVE